MSLLTTLMQNLRSDYTGQFDKNEIRSSRYGALNLFKDDTATNPIFDPETIANISRSYGNNVVVPVLDAQTIASTSGYTRTCAIADSENDSALVTLTFTSYGWRFSMTPATHYNNDVNMAQDFTRKMNKFALQFAADLDSACLAQLSTAKNQLWTNVAPDYYAQAADALQVPQADKNDFYNQLEAIMSQMDFYDQVNIVASTNHVPDVRRYAAQGTGNATNLAFQLDQRGYKWYPTNRLTNASGKDSTLYAVEAGSTFIMNRNDADTAIGHSIGGDYKVWSEELEPITGMVMGTFFQQDCADASGLGGAATAGNTRSLKQGYEFSTDVVTATVYNSDLATRYNPILKAEVLP